MLNDALRLIRVFHDLKQADLSRELGISPSFLSEIEKGKKTATFDLVQKYAAFFHIPASSIMLFSEKMDTEETPANEQERMRAARRILKLMLWIAKEAEGEGEDVSD